MMRTSTWLKMIFGGLGFVSITACTDSFQATNVQGRTDAASTAATAQLAALIKVGDGSILLNFTSAAQTLTANKCSGAVDVALQSSSGSAVTFQGSIGLPLSVSPSTLSFYSDAACTVASSMVTLQGSTATGRLYFKASAAASYTISANLLSLLSATQVETVQAPVSTPPPLAANAFTVSSPANNATVSASTLSIQGAAGSQWVNVAAYDVNNNNNKVGADVTPANGSYALSVTTSALVLKSGVASVRVMAFSTPAGQAGGTSASITLTLNVTSPPTPPASIPVSASGTTIPSATQIKDAQGNLWTVSAGVVLMNGQPAGYSANVILLLYLNGTIYQQNNALNWWSWSGTAWVAVAGDPRVASAPVPVTLVNADPNFTNGGGPVTVTNSQTAVIASLSGSDPLWLIFSDPWGVTSGTGSSSMTYTGKGAITTSVNYTGLNDAGVNGYPFIFYGSDPYGNHVADAKGPKFPAQLSAMSSLFVETTHSMTVNTAPGDLDIAFDQWLIPDPSYTGGQSGSVEVMVMYYYKFGYVNGCPLVNTLSMPMVLNGVSTSMVFREYACVKGPGSYVMFIPETNMLSANIKINMLDFMNEGAKTSGVGTNWYLAGIQFGSEFGHASAVNYTMSVTKLSIQQTFK